MATLDNPSEFVHDGRTIVPVAGTRVPLVASSTECSSVVITGENDNTGVIVVGGDTVVASAGQRRGHPLGAGASLTLAVNNLDSIYIDTTVGGDGVTYAYVI